MIDYIFRFGGSVVAFLRYVESGCSRDHKFFNSRQFIRAAHQSEEMELTRHQEVKGKPPYVLTEKGKLVLRLIALEAKQ